MNDDEYRTSDGFIAAVLGFLFGYWLFYKGGVPYGLVMGVVLGLILWVTFGFSREVVGVVAKILARPIDAVRAHPVSVHRLMLAAGYVAATAISFWYFAR
jgi:glycerol-3-phosphate acyltransferase PlsY